MEVSGRRLGGSDDHSTGVLCDPCKGENEDENAVFYCTVCNEYLCDVCGKSHQRAKATKSHRLLGRDSMPRQKLTSYEDTMCSKHSDKPLEYYCNVHDTCCCTVCATLDHKQCTIQYIDDVASHFERSKEYQSLVKAIADLTKLLHKTKDASTNNKKDIQSIHVDFVSDVRKFRAEINTILDSLENTSLTEAQRIKDFDDKTTTSVITECDTMATDMDKISSNMEKLCKYNQTRQLVICSKNATTQIKAYGKRLDELSKQSNIKHYKFIPNKEIRQILHSLTSLGQLKDTTRDEKNKHVDRSVMGADKLVQSPRQSVTASHVGDIDIRHSTDTEDCCIAGGVMIDVNKLALVDRWNSSVKVVNVNTNTVISCIELSWDPCGITCVNKDQVVVTCTKYDSNGKLVFLKVGKALSIMKELDIGGDCGGIVYRNNSFIITLDTPDSCVKIVNMSGKVLKTFKTDKVGGKLFSNPQYIVLSTDEQTIHVSDWGKGSVTSMSLDGTVQHVYTADNLESPQGLAVDSNDNVYIAGYGSHNIHQLSREGQLRQVLLDRTHELDCPQMVVYCKSGHKLYISNYDVGVVSVFQLQCYSPSQTTSIIYLEKGNSAKYYRIVDLL